MKSVHIRSFSGPYFPVFGLNTERYRISDQMRENTDQKYSEYGPFSRSATSWNFVAFILGMMNIWPPWKLSSFQNASPHLSIYVKNSSTPLTLDVQFQTTPSKKNLKRRPHYLLFRSSILLCMQLSKNITKCFLFVITHSFSTHFAINLFCLHNLKT